MNTEIFSEWLRRQGYRVYQTKSSYWYDAGPRALQAFPFGWIIQPSETELRELLVRHNVLALRYSAPLQSHQGAVSYHVVLTQPYRMDLLPGKARNGVRHGMKFCEVEPISLRRLAEEGWLLQKDTLVRQGREKSMSQQAWERICLSGEDLPGFIAWGAMIDGGLAATLLTVRVGDTYYVPYAQCLYEYMSKHVNNALFFNASCAMLSESGIKEIFFSLDSLDAPESINEFKFRMGFTARPVRQRVVIHPLLSPFANPASHQMVAGLVRRFPQSHILAKTEGMLRFHLRGKAPIEKQQFPECVAEEVQKYRESTETNMQ